MKHQFKPLVKPLITTTIYSFLIFLIFQPVYASRAAVVDQERIDALEAGEIDYANPVWWGFNEEDSTSAIQAAIDSGAARVLVPNLGPPWIVEPLFLVDDQEIIFQEGTVIEAKPGSFKGVADCLFTARGKNNIALRGHGATLRMRKQDYQGDDYQPAEWRHIIGLYGSQNIVIEGLRLESSGGDGIYIGSGLWRRPGYGPFHDKPGYCRDIVIRNIVADDNHRQGISVISVENLLIENAVLQNTAGTAPQAGIDIEPNSARNRLINIVLRNVLSQGNRGAGFFIHMSTMDHTTEPISIRFEDCVAKNNRSDGFSFHGPGGELPLPGLVEFINFRVENNHGPAINIREKPADSVFVRFVNATFDQVALRGGYPIWFQVRGEGWHRGGRLGEVQDQGGIEFVDCLLIDDQDRPFFGAISAGNVTVKLRDIRGNIEVRNPHGAEMRIDPEVEDFSLEVKLLD